ncbi:pyridoxamine 5'-phosphate oxidase family protein [Ensifer sp. MJa1]|uniref:pyridoxamine 5'-phosphate oxidase family protein n=1 Tax=Ensifer sp. MJa1 TaxID=2919888 RepID=UPI00300B08BB
MIVKEMSRHECSVVVQGGHVARLACCLDDHPYVVPITYAYAGNCLYAFSMPGLKIDWMRKNPNVCLQIDAVSGSEWKSVVIYGRYQELAPTGQWHREYLHAWSLLEKRSNWWEPGGLKPVPQEISGHYPHLFFSIDILEMTGRASCDNET